MTDLPKNFDREQFRLEAESYTLAWVKAWAHPGSGPSAGGRRDTRSIGARPDLPFIAEQRRVYTAMIDFFASTMVFANQTEEATDALRGIHRALDGIMGGGGGDSLRIETLNDIFLRTLELQTEMTHASKITSLVEHLRLVTEKLEGALGDSTKKRL